MQGKNLNSDLSEIELKSWSYERDDFQAIQPLDAFEIHIGESIAAGKLLF